MSLMDDLREAEENHQHRSECQLCLAIDESDPETSAALRKAANSDMSPWTLSNILAKHGYRIGRQRVERHRTDRHRP